MFFSFLRKEVLSFMFSFPDFVPQYDYFLNKEKIKYEEKKRPIESRITAKFGQLKLLTNEILFLNSYAKENSIVVYAGAAPGSHLIILSNLFSSLEFYLYDKNNFDKRLLKCKNVKIFSEFFTDELAESFKEKSVLFISDIRSGISEDHVKKDMIVQKKWCEIMKPRKASLKFRLPWISGETKYFSGKICKQPFIGSSSTETRIFTNCLEECFYNNDDYNDCMFYHNWSIRQSFHEFKNLSEFGIDHCYDCWFFTKVLKDYICSFFCKKQTYLNFLIKDILSTLYIKSLKIGPHGKCSEERSVEKRIKLLSKYVSDYIEYLIFKRNLF